MGSSQSKLIPIENELCCREPLNKFQLIDYSCHELLHTWTPSCSEAMVEIGGLSFKEGLKIYTSVYVVRKSRYYYLTRHLLFLQVIRCIFKKYFTSNMILVMSFVTKYFYV